MKLLVIKCLAKSSVRICCTMDEIRQLSFLFLLVLSLGVISSYPNTIKIGGIFCSEENSKEKTAFLLGLDYVNNNTAILPNTTLIPLVNYTIWTDPFSNIEAAYWQIYNGAMAIVGPTASDSIRDTHPLCAGFHIPQLAPHATDPVFEFSPSTYPYLIRMSSSDVLENQVLADVISHFNWTRLAVLTSRSSYGLNGLVAFKDIVSHMHWNLVAVESFRDFRNTSKINATTQLIHIRSRGARIVVLNCLASYVRVVIRQAKDLGMLNGWVWIVTSGAFAFDGILDSDGSSPDYIHGLIGIRHSFGHGKMYNTFKTLWEKSVHGKLTMENEASVGHTFDAVLVLANALHKMQMDGVLAENLTQLKFGIYDNTPTQYSSQGKLLLTYIREINCSAGVMGRLAFDEVRSPVDTKFDVVNLRGYGFEKVGEWNKDQGLVMEKGKEVIWPSGRTAVPSDSAKLLENQTISVVVIEEKPFITMKKVKLDAVVYEGYCIDLLNKLKEKLKFSYEIYLVPDKKFGSVDYISKEWNGMVREILEGRADLAVASFTISSERQKVIDFTQPYMDLGLSILIKSVAEEADYFTFLKPFRYDLWLGIVGTTIVVGAVLWLFSTFSPFGFYGRCVQIAHHKVPREHLKRRHTLRFTNSLWSSIVYYVGQSADSLHPVSASGRITVAFYWFSLLIIMSTYTANLAASLTIRRFTSPISSVEDLARQSDIAYGTVEKSQPQTFFETSSIPSFVTMWQYMKYHHTLLKSSADGIERVRKGGFAFIWDSVVLEHIIHSEECGTLTTVGKLFGKIGYGIGLLKDSPYTKQLSNAILELRASGYLEILEKKWLHSHGQCSVTHGRIGVEGSQLGLGDMAGVFLVLCVGILLSFSVLLLEWIAASKRDTTEDDPDAPVTMKEALQTRLSKTWHDWRKREDVPGVPRFISNVLKEQFLRLQAFFIQSWNKSVSRQSKVRASHTVTEEQDEDESDSGEQQEGEAWEDNMEEEESISNLEISTTT